MATLTADEVRALLDYDPLTGVFRWRVDRGSRARSGQPTGCRSCKGAVVIRIMGKLYYAHRLAWLHAHGTWPPNEVDHINGDPTDNRLGNLRLATRMENTRNVKTHKDTASGLKGAYRQKKKWSSRIYVAGRDIYLGTFDTAEQAAAAYDRAAAQHHGSFARVNGG